MKRIILFTIGLCVASAISARAADATENWTKHCASCHGKDGKGETKAGKKAEAKDLTDAKYQASFTDEQATTQIKDGMKKDGKERMKPFKDKLTDDEIKALVPFLRGLKK